MVKWSSISPNWIIFKEGLFRAKKKKKVNSFVCWREKAIDPPQTQNISVFTLEMLQWALYDYKWEGTGGAHPPRRKRTQPRRNMSTRWFYWTSLKAIIRNNRMNITCYRWCCCVVLLGLSFGHHFKKQAIPKKKLFVITYWSYLINIF